MEDRKRREDEETGDKVCRIRETQKEEYKHEDKNWKDIRERMI